MPVYNSGEYLKTAVESILNQSLREIELILVDDGSTDGSSERCDEYARQDSRVVVIHQKNGGICAARNAALKIARGEYIGFSDHDDEYRKGLLEENYNIGIKSRADVVKYGSHWVLQNKGNIYREYDHKYEDAIYDRDSVKKDFWRLLRMFVFNLVWDGLFRRSFLIDNNISFNTDFKTGGEDNDFMWNCVGAGASFALNSKIYYNHYVRTGISTSATYKESSIQSNLDKPAILLKDIEALGLNIEDSKVEYARFWLERSLGGLCHTLANPGCNWETSKKVETLKSLKEKSYYRKWILSVSPLALLKIASAKYVLLQQLYRFGFYELCLKLYELQYKERGIK